MNTPIILAAIAIGGPASLMLAFRFAPLGYQDRHGFHLGTPSPCERDAQDGRGEGAERGLFLTNHIEGINS